MNLNFDIDALREKGREMKEIADYFSVSFDNLKWEIELPLSEQFILNEAKTLF